MRLGIQLLGLMLVASLIVGCGEGDKTGKTDKTDKTDKTAASTDGDGEALAFANANCPMMGGEVDTEGEFSVFNGKKIGYCCEGCKEGFEKLTDEEKQAKLAETNPEKESAGS